MGRRVKLIDLNIYGDSTNAFKAPNGKYYSSEINYEKIKQENEYRQKCILYIHNLIGYELDQKLPTTVYKFISEYGKSYSYEALYHTMISQEKSAQWSLETKEFKTENSKVVYLFAIYRNNIMTEYRKLKKKSIKNIEDEHIQFEDLDNKKHKVSDISCFLDDEE